MESPVAPSSSPAGSPVIAALPEDVLQSPAGEPAVLLARTARGWTVLSPVGTELPREGLPGLDADTLDLVEAMSLADLVAGELGTTPEPDRKARKAARSTSGDGTEEAPAPDPRDAEIVTLRRTVGQLEHALAARVSIERAIGVLAERHGTTPRDAFEDLRRRARSQGRPAAELAGEVLDDLPARAAVPGQRTAPVPTALPTTALPTTGLPPAGEPAPRRLQRSPRHPAGEGTVPEARS